MGCAHNDNTSSIYSNSDNVGLLRHTIVGVIYVKIFTSITVAKCTTVQSHADRCRPEIPVMKSHEGTASSHSQQNLTAGR